MINLAKKRFSKCHNNFWTANAWSWKPPIKFDYVYSLYDYVPYDYLKEYIEHLLLKYVIDDGLLVIGAYGSRSQNQPAKNIEDDLRKLNFSISGCSKVSDLPISIIIWIKKLSKY